MRRLRGIVTATVIVLAAPAQAQGIVRDARLAVLPQGATSSGLLERPARLAVEGVALPHGLQELQSRSGVSLAFSPSMLPVEPRVSCACASLTVGEALDRLLAHTPFRYTEVGNHIVIESVAPGPPLPRGATGTRSPSDSTPAPSPVAAAAVLPAANVTIAERAAPGRIQGKITSRAGLPLKSVQVGVQGSARGTTTNDAGEYTIANVPEGRYTLIARMIGFAPANRAITVADGQVVTADFVLETQALALDEVVVTGTPGAAKKREIGNAISQIDISKVPEPISSVDNLLQGRASGMTVVQNSGQIGGGATIRLRGNVSATMSNQPLIYVDGVRMRSDGYPKNTFPVGYSGNSDNTVYSPLNDISPDDIDRVEVIKGPAATTLYGTEAAAGVIQIFTKKGKTGATRWTFGMDQAMSKVRPFGPTRGFDGAALAVPTADVSPYGTPDYMYLEPWLRTGRRSQYFLSLDGGLPTLQYFVSGTWEDQTGTLPNDEGQRFGVRGNFTATPRPELQIQWQSAFSHNSLQKTPTGGTAAGLTLNAFRRNRNYFTSADPAVISQVLAFDLDNMVDHLITGAVATYQPFQNFTNRVTVGYDLAQQETRGLMPFGFPTTPQGQLNDQRWSNRTLTADYAGTVNLTLRKNVSTNFSVGAQSVTTDESQITAASVGFPGPGDPTVSSGATTIATEDRMRVVNAGFFVQNVFNVLDRYFLTTGVRYDGNSAFGSNLGLQAYPKVSVSYVVSDEPFWQPWMGVVKLRAAYGQSGRAPGAFDAVRTWTPMPWNGQTSFFPRNLGNPDLGPERTSEWEGGLDGAFFGQRLTVEFTGYQRVTRDALFSVGAPPSAGGWNSQLRNVGKLQSSGFELTANGTLLERAGYGWDLGGSYSTNSSKTLSLGGAAPFTLGNFGWVVEGQPMPVMRARCVSNPGAYAAPVIVNDCDIGPNLPTRTINANTAIRLPHGISVSARGEYQGGNYAYSLMDGESITRGIRWPACFNSYPAIDAKQLSQVTAAVQARCIASNASRDLAIFPMDFFRLRDLTVRAILPSSLVRARSASLSLSAQNFYTWKKAKDSFLDPETSGGFTTGNTGMSEKVHSVGGSIPIPTSFILGLRVDF
jgi:outer membrane receptor protein involved in Fe transport